MSADAFDTVWINGSVGAGKSTTAAQLGEELKRRGVPGAVIDVDELRRSWPSPDGDPFGTQVALVNLEAVAGNYRMRGAQIVVIAGVIESREELTRSADVVGTRRMLHVRLTIERDCAIDRLRTRHDHDASGLEWHERRHPELAQILDRAGFENDVVFDTSTTTAAEVARKIADVLLPAGRE